MNKLSLLLFFSIALLLASCGAEAEKKPTNFGAISNTQTDQHTRVAGTKTFLVIPEGYARKESFARFQKKEKLYFQIMEMPVSYEEAKVNLSKEAIESKGAAVNVYKEIKINDYDGIYFEGPSKYPGETKLGIWFGDETFVASIVAVCEDSDTEGKEELIEIVRSAFYEKSFELDPFELASFTFNKDSFDFKFNTQFSTMFIFTPNGIDDSTESPDVPSITIGPLPFMSKEGAQNYTNELIQGYETQQRATFISETTRELELVDQTVSIFEAQIEMEGKITYLYQTVLLGQETSLLFMGTCTTGKEQHPEIFERALQSVRFKDAKN